MTDRERLKDHFPYDDGLAPAKGILRGCAIGVVFWALVIVAFVSARDAHATMYMLVSCEFQFVPEYNRSVYIGTYKSQYGNLFTATFDSYCPATINR